MDRRAAGATLAAAAEGGAMTPTHPPSLADLATQWQLDPALALLALTTLALYGWGVRRAGGRWPWTRAAAFAAGVGAALAALCSGLDGYATELLSIHMAQHLALTLVAAPLLVAGAPVALALRTLPRGGRHALARLLRSRTARLLTHPLTTWTLFVGVILASHLTGLYEAALRHPAVHAGEHLLLLTTGILFWLPVLGAEPIPHRPGWVGRTLYLLLAMPAMGSVGVVLSISEHVRYPSYIAPARAMGVSALGDQHAAGALMWAGGSILAAALTAWISWIWLVREEARAVAREAYMDGAR
jgi:putative membrane protein